MQKLFTYGTLQHPEVQEDLFGKTLKGTPETLLGYRVREIQIEEELRVKALAAINRMLELSEKIK